MNYTSILKKGEGLILWVYKSITNKFTNIFKKLLDRFPVLNQYPALKYSLIPVLVTLFLLARYVIKFVINELAAWTSGFAHETTGYSISERTIVLAIAAVFVISRIVLKVRSEIKKKDDELVLRIENAN